MIVNQNGTPHLCYKDEGPFSEETHEKIKIIVSIGVRGEDGKDHYTDSEYYAWGPKTRPYVCLEAKG